MLITDNVIAVAESKARARVALAVGPKNVCAIHTVGSGYIKGEGNDVDVLVLVRDTDVRELDIDDMNKDGSAAGAQLQERANCWQSFKAGFENIIVVNDLDYFTKWLAAAELCKFLHQAQQAGLSEKAIRVGVHCMVMDAFDAAKALAYAATVGPAPEVSSTQVLDAGVPMEAVGEHE